MKKSRLKQIIKEEFIKILKEAKSVDKIKKELVQTIDDLKKNFPLFKKAKESGDTKNYEKYKKIALDLTKKKKDLEKEMDKALGTLHADAELELKESKLNEFNPGALGAVASATKAARDRRKQYGNVKPDSNIDTKWKDEEDIEKDLKAFITSKPEKADDLWSVFKNIMKKGQDWLTEPAPEQGKKVDLAKKGAADIRAALAKRNESINEAPMDDRFAKEFEEQVKAFTNHIKHELSSAEGSDKTVLQKMHKNLLIVSGYPKLMSRLVGMKENNSTKLKDLLGGK